LYEAKSLFKCRCGFVQFFVCTCIHVYASFPAGVLFYLSFCLFILLFNCPFQLFVYCLSKKLVCNALQLKNRFCSYITTIKGSITKSLQSIDTQGNICQTNPMMPMDKTIRFSQCVCDYVAFVFYQRWAKIMLDFFLTIIFML